MKTDAVLHIGFLHTRQLPDDDAFKKMVTG
jgi:hypothetical protein